MNKKTTEYNSNILLSGFVEGFYSPEDSYAGIEGIEMKENKKQGESVEDMVIDTEDLLRNARGQ